jgi:hypothetical protein
MEANSRTKVKESNSHPCSDLEDEGSGVAGFWGADAGGSRLKEESCIYSSNRPWTQPLNTSCMPRLTARLRNSLHWLRILLLRATDPST